MIGKRGYLLQFPESFLKSNYIRRLRKRNFHSDLKCDASLDSECDTKTETDKCTKTISKCHIF